MCVYACIKKKKEKVKHRSLGDWLSAPMTLSLPTIWKTITTTAVLDIDESLLSSVLQWHQSHYSNEVTSMPILLEPHFSAVGTLRPK